MIYIMYIGTVGREEGESEGQRQYTQPSSKIIDTEHNCLHLDDKEHLGA